MNRHCVGVDIPVHVCGSAYRNRAKIEPILAQVYGKASAPLVGVRVSPTRS